MRLGATWIDKEYIQQFMYETFKTPPYLRDVIEVKYVPYTAEWQVTGKNSVGYNNVAAYTTYGTNRANAYKILEDSLNLRDVRIYDTVEDADGKERRVLTPRKPPWPRRSSRPSGRRLRTGYGRTRSGGRHWCASTMKK